MTQPPKPENKWENILTILRKNRRDFAILLTDNELRIRIQFFAVYALFFLISTVMTVVNISTHFGTLGLATLLFAVVNLWNVACTLLSRKLEKLSQFFFSIEIIALFTYFILNGEPQGFSAIWIALLPACGLLLYQLKHGTIISAVMLVILVFLFRTDYGRSLLPNVYTTQFLIRFPVLYIAFFAVGAFFEFVRLNTQRQLIKTQQQFENLSRHDPLTGLNNRMGFYATVDEESALHPSEDGRALAILDFDSFKYINDHYGHNCGDLVLTDASIIISSIVQKNGCVCRWGGDEIAIFFYSQTAGSELSHQILEAMRAHEFVFEDEHFHSTVSIGVTTVEPGIKHTLSDLVGVADKNLYVCKNCGKDRLIISSFAEVLKTKKQLEAET